MQLITDATAREREYHHGLEACFPGFWNEAVLRWYLPRQASRMLAFEEGGSLVAGTGINFRHLLIEPDEHVGVAFLTGAWTLPDWRGQGLFSRLIEAAREQAADAGCRLLASFVTADNASAKATLRLGAATVAGHYIFSATPPASGTVSSAAPPDAAVAQALLQGPPQPGAVRFDYPTPDGWRRQYVARPYPVSLMRCGDGAAGLVEDTGRALRIVRSLDPDWQLALQVLHLARDSARQMFCYSTRADAVEFARQHGLETKPGYITLLDTGSESGSCGAHVLARARWDVEAGDKV